MFHLDEGAQSGCGMVTGHRAVEAACGPGLRSSCPRPGELRSPDGIWAVRRARGSISFISLCGFLLGRRKGLPAVGAFLQPHLLSPYMKTETKSKTKNVSQALHTQGKTTRMHRPQDGLWRPAGLRYWCHITVTWVHILDVTYRLCASVSPSVNWG